jgi:TolB-like protein/DNA-binding SARP family transcriptional activator
MPTSDGSDVPRNEGRISANSDVDRKPDSHVRIAPADNPLTGEQKTEQHMERVGSWWRNWWQHFRSEFYEAHPEKQVAEVYYITAILALTGSLIAGLWAFSEHFWSEKPAMGTQNSALTPETAAATRTTPAPSLSIVVMPFVNLSGDAAQEYFADGITDSLTTDLSRALPGSFVVARETAFTYKGKAIDARQIGRELHVRYALEGSALLEGEQIRVNARLVDAQMGNEIWGERFDTARGDVLRVQDEIVGRLSRAIGLQVISFEARRSEREKPGSAEAIDLVLRGQAALNRPSSAETMIAARDLFQRALKLQPDNVDALAGVATSYIFEVLNGYYDTGNELRLQRAEPLLASALALDDRHLVALKARAALLRAKGEFDGAIMAAQAVIAQNPGEPWAYKEVALSMMYRGRTADALDWFEKAELFGPRDPGRWTWLAGKGQVLILLGRDEEAIASLRAAIESNPADLGDYAVLAAAYALSGRNEEARAALAQYSRVHPAAIVANFRNLSPVPLQLTDPSYLRQRERLKNGLRKAGMPD